MMLMAGQLLLAALVLVSGLGLVRRPALVASARWCVLVAMFAAERLPVRRLWISLVWLATAIAGVLLLAGLGGAAPLPSVVLQPSGVACC